MKKMIDNAMVLVIGLILFIAMLTILLGCENKNNSHNRNIVILAFGSDSCIHCNKDHERLAVLSKYYHVVRVDVYKEPESAKKYNVTSLPTYVVLKQYSNEVALTTTDIETVFAHLRGVM